MSRNDPLRFPIPLDEVDATRRDPGRWLHLHGRMRAEDDRARIFVPKALNVLQRRAAAVYSARMASRKPCRLVLLKPRGRGGSTTIGALAYHHGMNFPSRFGVIGTKGSASDNAMDIVKVYAEHDDFPGWSPKVINSNMDVLEFEHQTLFEKYTAQTPEAARSARLQGYWATEVGRWPAGGATDGQETLESMRGSLPKTGFHLVGEESTPQGSYGPFYTTFDVMGRWPTAEECGVEEGQEWWRIFESFSPQNVDSEAGDAQYIRIFAAWFEFEDSFRSITDAEKLAIEGSLTKEEIRLADCFGNEGPQGFRLGNEVVEHDWLEQLAWRRMMLNSEFKGNPIKFEQEHPSDPKTCFLSSGSPVFDPEGVGRLEVLVKSGHWKNRGTLDTTADGRPIFIEDRDGWFEMWEEPKAGLRYAVVVDPASGKSQTEAENADRHAVGVLRAEYEIGDNDRTIANPAMVARVVPPNQFIMETLGECVEMLSRFYGNCIVIPEMNNYGGGALLEQIKKRDLPLYKRKKTNINTSSVTEFEGWQTTEVTRRQIIENMRSMVLYQEFDIWCPNALSEIRTFVRKANGRLEAAEGSHDDDVLMLAIGMYLTSQFSEFKVPVSKHPQTPTDRYMDWDVESDRARTQPGSFL
jgi:hypothetical protein